MKPITFSVCLFVVLVGSGCGVPSPVGSLDQNAVANAGESPATIASNALQRAGNYAGEWSEPVNGLSARLLVTLQESPNSSRFGAGPIILEVKNTYSTPLAFINQPSFKDKAIWDAKGNVLPEASHPGNHLSGNLEWAVIPGNAYLGLRVDTSIPVEVGLCFGVLAPEAQSLSATLVAKNREGPENQWVGEILLPPVSFTSNGTDR